MLHPGSLRAAFDQAEAPSPAAKAGGLSIFYSKASLGSELYQAMNSSIACWYERRDCSEPKARSRFPWPGRVRECHLRP
jgi:hypothetical protein